MCVGLQMKLKFHLTYILLTVSTILAEDIYSRQSKRSPENGSPDMIDFEDFDSDEDSSEPDFESPELTTISTDLESDKNVETSEQSDDNSAKTKELDETKTETMSDMEDKPNDEDESDIFDTLEKNFNFDDMGSDVKDHDSYLGDSPQHDTKKKWKWPKKQGPPRYPPIDKDKLYEIALLAYTRDFHLGMLIR